VKKVSPSSSFHFRPHTDDNNEENLTENLLYMQQEKWEAELLARYGNSIVLMDATYKTTKYELPPTVFYYCENQCWIQHRG